MPATDYQQRYTAYPDVVKAIDALAKLARDHSGSLVSGFCQGRENSLKDAATYKYSVGGACFAMVTRWFRGKFAGESDAAFFKWLLSDTPTMDVSDVSTHASLTARDAQLDKWMKRQHFAPVRITVDHIVDVSDPITMPDSVTSLANPKEPGVLLDKDSKYNHATKGAGYLSKPSGTYKHITPVTNLPQMELWSMELKHQLVVRKILKKSTESNKFNTKSRSQNFRATLDRTKVPKVTTEELLEVGDLLLTAISSCSATFGTTELYINFGLKEQGKGGHVMGIHHRSVSAFSSGTQSVLEFFDPNFGFYRWTGENKAQRLDSFRVFILTFLKCYYPELAQVEFDVLARS
ncbi:hypothetical protein [Vitiosangium sp. GDMCC 1.1324]|uniref:hypothetical protein n=1 Tax=Vitiosangium sp. (strain GDMCC 1.1324) TaxID=2138576 RepID=UPI000D3C310C|nr:hypothetical protein [Vitiosangium sp. GDMCC 1.1324]PTL80259.1 hypothetical protein DAT35_30180 [Vitiosangium sp. GDMCC 1.1324]